MCVSELTHYGSVYHLYLCVCACVWLRSKASLTSQHGLGPGPPPPLRPPPWPLLRSLAPTTATRPIAARRCDGQPPTPRTPRAEGLDGEDERRVNKGLWCWQLWAPDWMWVFFFFLMWHWMKNKLRNHGCCFKIRKKKQKRIFPRAWIYWHALNHIFGSVFPSCKFSWIRIKEKERYRTSLGLKELQTPRTEACDQPPVRTRTAACKCYFAVAGVD